MASPAELLEQLKQSARPQAMDASDLASIRGTARYKKAYAHYLNNAKPAESLSPEQRSKLVEEARRAAVQKRDEPTPTGDLPSAEHSKGVSRPDGYTRTSTFDTMSDKDRMKSPMPGDAESGVSAGGKWAAVDALAYEEAMQTRDQMKARGE